jgi:hypothetical protein
MASIGCDSAQDVSEGVAAGTPASWMLEQSPRVSIGVVEGDERYQFIRVTSGWRRSDGSIVVLDVGRPGLVFFDSAGTYLHERGRRGEGPGEMQRVAVAWPYRGDSIAMYDYVLRRVSIFDGDGTFARSFLNPLSYQRKPGTVPSQTCCLIWQSFADGSFVGRPPDEIPVTPGPSRYSVVRMMRVSADGVQQDTIGAFDARLYSYDAGRPSKVVGHAGSYGFSYQVVGDRFIGAHSLAGSLTVIGPAGSDSIIVPFPEVPFSPGLPAEYEAALREDYATRGARKFEGSLESNLPRAYAPTTTRVLNMRATADGDLWLMKWTPRYNRVGWLPEYAVIDLEGRHIANIALPAEMQVLWSNRLQVLAVEQDSLDVPYVRLYDIRARNGSIARRHEAK